MLANGATLGYKATEQATTYTDLPGLKKFPDLGNKKEKIENTGLSDTNKQYEYGIGDFGDLEFEFKYNNSTANTAYRLLKACETAGTSYPFQFELPDGTTYAFTAQVNVTLNGGGVNEPVNFKAGLAISSNMVITNPV